MEDTDKKKNFRRLLIAEIFCVIIIIGIIIYLFNLT